MTVVMAVSVAVTATVTIQTTAAAMRTIALMDADDIDVLRAPRGRGRLYDARDGGAAGREGRRHNGRRSDVLDGSRRGFVAQRGGVGSVNDKGGAVGSPRRVADHGDLFVGDGTDDDAARGRRRLVALDFHYGGLAGLKSAGQCCVRMEIFTFDEAHCAEWFEDR
jgi:hypothetical protein